MNRQQTVKLASRSFIILSALSLLMVSFMAIVNPQSVMDLVQVQLTNTDAYSSIRGVYGGVGLCLVIHLMYLLFKNVQMALGLLCLLWGFYVVSRVITMFHEGPLGAFGSQWIVIESILFAVALTLFSATYMLQHNTRK